MKRALVALALLSSAVTTPEVAQAKAVEDVNITADAQDIVLTVVADEALRAPTIRTYAGSVRIRFYDAKDTPLLRLVGDGGAVRSVDVSEGSDKSAAVVLVLGDRTRLAPSDVRVERAGEKTVFRIARGLLPVLREGSPMNVAQAVAPKPAAKPVAAPAAAPAAAVTAPVQATSAAPAAPVAKPATAQQAAPEVTKPAPSLGVKAPAKVDPGRNKKLTSGDSSSSSSAIPMLIAVSALLALAYGALRLFLKKQQLQSGEAIPVIDVIAQKRLGPRHQLVIVRAFDRDYLLSIQGGQTTVIARSSRSRKIEAAEELLSPVSPRRATNTAAEARPFGEEDDEVTFGGELFKSALEQRERARDQTAGFRLEAARAEARAELSRDTARQDFAINAFARDPIRSDEPVRGDSIREALRSESAREQTRESLRADAEDSRTPSSPSGVVESTPDAMSESVSGLLRLRKASGR